MKFLADENFPKQSVNWLRKQNIDITSIREVNPGISDLKVLEIAIAESRTILTLDSDFGTLIFKFNQKPKAGVIFFRLIEFEPLDLSKALINLVKRYKSFENSLIVIDKNSIRKRKY
ncbi:MAG: DUF5615 family PIN-like protein [Cyclobacteriaceae bacterium]|nr:DUF5615 family PIN-like protein [Cyclobacteriaceae bacterium]